MIRSSSRLGALAVAFVVGLGAVLATGGTVRAGTTRDPGPFAGLGAWVDAFDYAPAFQGDAGVVTVTPDAVPDMAALGVETLYLQAAMNDSRSPGRIIDRRLVGEFLRRAHREDMEVVAWYFPTLDDASVDIAHMKAMADFEYRGETFDALALDIEAIQSVPEVRKRNDRVVRIAKKSRELVEDQPMAAIVYPAVQAEVINPTLWPNFPYKRLAKHVDVWMPMTYWTFRDGPYRDPYAYTTESIDRLRDNLDDKRAVVHPIGGIGDLSGAKDYDAFLRAVDDTKSVGWSIYDYNTMATTAWLRLRPGGITPPPTTPRTTQPTTRDRR